MQVKTVVQCHEEVLVRHAHVDVLGVVDHVQTCVHLGQLALLEEHCGRVAHALLGLALLLLPGVLLLRKVQVHGHVQLGGRGGVLLRQTHAAQGVVRVQQRLAA